MSSHLKTVQPTKNIYTKLEDVLYPKPSNLSELNNFPSIQHIPNKNISKLNSNKPKAQQPQTTKYINKPYVSAFITSVKNIKDNCLNSQECVNLIEKEFNILTEPKRKVITSSNGDEQYIQQEEIEPNDLNFMELARMKIEKNMKLYDPNNIRMNAVMGINNPSDNNNEFNINNTQPIENTTLQESQKPLHPNNEKKKPNKRFQILKHNLTLLKCNNISIGEFMLRNPFQTKPYSIEGAIDFIEAVKFDKANAVEYFLRKSKTYLFVFDFFHQTAYHWAAKRNNVHILSILIQNGRHINQLDINHRTPLYLAARNNNVIACKMLMDNDGNPFIPDCDGKLPTDVTQSQEVRNLLLANGDIVNSLFKFNNKK